ncbi:hypothetical protein LTR86_009979 [Recurvomyces mirabilis]|nr:hypothetical protein LTR86_009979 [Recurvomyces mirabilis]
MASANIHTGFWTDHFRGSVLGGTITLEAEYGGQLVSAAAIVVQIIGAAVWTIAEFFIHQRRAKPGLRDEYEAQSQVLLRNTAGAESATFNILGLGWTWHGHKQSAWRKAISLAATPAFIYTSFVIAGVFVNQIATSTWNSPTVLIREGQYSGFIDYTGNDAESEAGFSHVTINVSTAAPQYARSCYAGRGSISATSCSVYPEATLGYNISDEQPCPIPGARVCYGGEDGRPITLITDILDSHGHLGINAAKQDRLNIQYQTTCAPLDYEFVDSYIYLYNESSPWWPCGNTTTEYYRMGNITQAGETTDTMYVYSPTIRYWGVGTTGYFLNPYQSLAPHKATYARSNTGSQPVPNGFWRTEVEGWFQAVLAKMQLIQTVFVDVPGDVVEVNHIQVIPAATLSTELAKQCSQQRIAAPLQYQSYNVFALVFIAVVGVVVFGIAAGLRLGLEHPPGAHRQGHRFLCYEAEGLLSLHRMALEGAGITGRVAGMNGTLRLQQANRRIPQAILGPREMMENGEVHSRLRLVRYPDSDGSKGTSSSEDVETDKRGYRQLAVEDGL